MRKLRIGIIGLGIGARHLEAYRAHPDCEVAALCDLSERRLEEEGMKSPASILTTRADDILNHKGIDLVSIASFDDVHFEQTIRALENGKHVFVEKPLCLHRDQACRIREALTRKKGPRLSSNLNLRTTPLFVWLRKAIQAGEFGQLYSMEGDYLWGRIQKLTEGWRGKMDFYSVIHGAAVHMIDLVGWLRGAWPIEVAGYGNRICTSGSGFAFNDFSTLLLKFEDGLIAKITANAGCVHPHFHRLDVFGTKKTFTHHAGGAWLFGERGSEGEKLSYEYPGSRKGEVIFSFVDSILQSKPPLVSEDDVFSVMSVCFAAEQSVSEGRPVQIDYIT